MLLYVMRHGPAEDRAPTGRDADRPLSPAGRTVVERAANDLRARRLGRPLPRILSSPLLRAQQTAAIVHRIACEPTTQIEEAEELGTDPPSGRTLLELTRQLGRGSVDCLLLGHNPHVEDLVQQLVAGPVPTRGFRTAMIVLVEPDGLRFRARDVIDPHSR
jgi:phosphohistidine phosphatase